MGRAPIKLLPDREELQRLFAYEPETGVLSWRSNPKFNGLPVGRLGTVTSRGYRTIGIGGRYFLAHRIIWKMVTGNEPVFQIDHINGDRLNNKWRNLRIADNQQNLWNSKLRTDNKSGFKGVHLRRGKYRAAIKQDGRIRYLGTFDTAEGAAAIWQQEAAKQRGAFFRLS